MIDYKKARINMVDSQIHPMGVVDEPLLEAFSTVPREQFVSEEKAPYAYNDEDLALDHGCFLIEPSVHARLIQALDIKKNDSVLDIAGANGYSAAILSSLAETVIAVNECKNSCETAQKNWNAINAINIAGFHVPHNADGDKNHGPYDCILVNGSIARIPNRLSSQLKDGGRLAAVLKPEGSSQGRAILYIRSGDNFSKRELFDCNIPFVKGLEPIQEFVF